AFEGSAMRPAYYRDRLDLSSAVFARSLREVIESPRELWQADEYRQRRNRPFTDQWIAGTRLSTSITPYAISQASPASGFSTHTAGRTPPCGSRSRRCSNRMNRQIAF